MTIIRATLQRRHLRAALITAACHDIRYYLNGLLIELHRDCAFIAGTDGHRITIIRDIEGGSTEAPPEGVQFIVPRAVAQRVKASSRGLPPYVGAAFDTEADTVSLDDDGLVTGARRIEGTFPDWRRIVPKQVSGETARFNCRYLADLPKLCKALGANPISLGIATNGPGAALLSIDGMPEFVGVLMPLRGELQAAPRMEMGKAPPTGRSGQPLVAPPLKAAAQGKGA